MTSPDPNAQSGTGDGQSAGTDGQGTGTGTGDGTATGQGTGNDDQGQQQQSSNDTVSRAEFDQLRNQLRAADQRRQKAEDDLKQLRDKDLPAQEKLQRDLAEATKARDEALEALKTARLENAFYADNTIKWRNPKTALRLADLSNVTIDEDGKVNGLVPALQALAKSDPYLVEEASGEGGEGGAGGKGSTGATGAGGRQTDTKPDVKKMAGRFPALRTRGLGG